MSNRRGRGIYDVGLSEGTAERLRLMGRDPAAWTCLEVWTSAGDFKCGILIERAEAEKMDTIDSISAWLNRRDAFLRAV
jgi:hypothetical protein